VQISGRVVVVDEDGIECHNQSGYFVVLQVEKGKKFAYPWSVVTVEAGCFVTTVVTGGRLWIQTIEMGGRTTLAEEKTLRALPGMTLRGRWLADTSLRVVDSRSGADLPEVVVVRCSSRSLRIVHPGDYPNSDVLVNRQPSPVTLTAGRDHQTPPGREYVWVGASGYAWMGVTIDYANPLERLCELQPDAALEVHIAGTLPKESWSAYERWPSERSNVPRLRVRTLEGALVLEGEVSREQPVRVDGLAPGTYDVAVEMGDPWEPLELGKAACQTEAGITTRVTVTVKPPPDLR
jgi:hypothetical protein